MIQVGGGTHIFNQVIIMAFPIIIKSQMDIIQNTILLEMHIGEVDGGMVHLEVMTVTAMLTLVYLGIIILINQIIITLEAALTLIIKQQITLQAQVKGTHQTGTITLLLQLLTLIQMDIGLEELVE